MKTFDFSGLSVCCGDDEACKKAAKLFFGEIQKRTGILPLLTDTPKPPSVSFVCAPQKNKDSYTISYNGGVLTISGEGIRSLIYGYSYFLRKSEYRNGKITLIRDISGEYVPIKGYAVTSSVTGTATIPTTRGALTITGAIILT